MGCCSAPQSFSPSTYCLSTLTLVIIMLETHASLFLLFWKFSYFTVHGTVKPSCPLSRKTAPEHNGSTSMLDGGDVVLWVILSISLPPNSVRFHLTTALCPKPLNHLKVNWQTLNGSVHEQGPRRCCSLLQQSVLPAVFLVTGDPTSVRSSTSSFSVVLR